MGLHFLVDGQRRDWSARMPERTTWLMGLSLDGGGNIKKMKLADLQSFFYESDTPSATTFSICIALSIHSHQQPRCSSANF